MPAIYWAYSNRTPYQIEDIEWNPVSAADMGLVYDPSLPPTGDNVWQDKLDALSRPYPMLIAGLPNWWNFDPSDTQRVFTLQYRKPIMTGGTRIFAPRRLYGDNPSVDVTGGTWGGTSRKVVVIQNDGTADPVTVKITANPS